MYSFLNACAFPLDSGWVPSQWLRERPALLWLAVGAAIAAVAWLPAWAAFSAAVGSAAAWCRWLERHPPSA